MGLTNAVANTLKQVEAATGLPVHVAPDSTLPQHILAKVTMARDQIPFHQVAYRTDASEAPDYLIVYQCGFILRRYAAPPGDRADFVSTGQGEAAVRNWALANSKHPHTEKAASLTGFLHSGLLHQLCSIPVGLRVDEWILQEFPELRALQQKALTRQINDNAAVFRPDVQGTFPAQALALNAAMSAAFALFWSEKLQQDQLVLPYRASGYLEQGRKLFELWRSIPSAPAQDNRLVDEWAGLLGMGAWYHWQPASD